jgi:hypothetical protein
VACCPDTVNMIYWLFKTLRRMEIAVSWFRIHSLLRLSSTNWGHIMHVRNISNCANCMPNPLRSTYVIHRLKNDFVHILCKSSDRAVGIAIDYGLDNGGFADRVPVRSRNVTSPYCSDQLWGTHNLLSNEYCASFSRGKAVELPSWPLTSN